MLSNYRSHVYIPILPRCLLGVLSAPVPLILGLNSAFLPTKEDEDELKSDSGSRDGPPYTDEDDVRDPAGLVSGSGARTTSSDMSEPSPRPGPSSTSSTKTFFGSTVPESPMSTASSTFVNVDERYTDGERPPVFVDDRYYAVFPPEVVQVYLDENRIDFGSLGPPPRLPERRRKKLYTDLVAMAGTPCFDQRPADWNESVQPYYDSAFKMSIRPDMANVDDDEEADEIDDKAIRGVFLKFFVSILQNYRKFLVYPSKADPFPKRRFRDADFLASSPADWREFLQPLLDSQAFHQFVDLRLSRSGWTDPEIIFFDESIDAKINRYTFRLHKHDTPFLTNESNKHTKTYVAPTVDMEGLEGIQSSEGSDKESEGQRPHTYVYSEGFPELQAHLFAKKKSDSQSNAKLFGISDADSTQRLKRVSTLRLPFGRKRTSSSAEEIASRIVEEDGHVSGGGYSPACVFSTFLTLWGSFISTGLSEPKVVRAPPTLSQVMGRHLNMAVNKTDSSNEKGIIEHDSPEESDEFTLLSKPLSPHKSPHKKPANSVSGSVSGSTTPSNGSFVHFNDDLRDEYLTITRSAIKIAFELFHVMNLRKFAVDANVYRTLANACAVCGAGDRAIDLLQTMLAHKMLPDRAICASIASAISFSMGESNKDTPLDAAEDLQLVAPKDVYEAAVNNNLKNLVKLMQNSRTEEDEAEDMLLVDKMSSRPSPKEKKRFNLFSRNNANERKSSYCGGDNCNNTGISSKSTDSSAGDVQQDDELLASVGAASPRFCSQIILAERTLEFIFPNLEIDVANPFGTTCPNFKCGEALLMSELMENYAAFDPNAYTVTCPHCSKAFVPRFTVFSTKEGWVGSEGPGTLLWCELLSPWVLQKEVMSVIEEYGIKKIVSNDFKIGKSNPQFAVLFWNLIVSFRLYGLPYAFLICEKPSLAFLIPLD